jgi:hypothetical protein
VDLDPDRVSFIRVRRIARCTATGTAGFSPEDWDYALPHVLTEITATINPERRHQSCPRAVTCARRDGPPTIRIRRGVFGRQPETIRVDRYR